MTKGLNIVSRLTFENIPDGTLPTSIPDENQYSNYSYTRYAGTVSVNVETVNGIKFIKLASSTSNSKIYAQNVINDQSKKNFQAEFDVIFDSISTEMTLAAIGSSNALTTMLRVVAYADPKKGIALVNDTRTINSYYKFETNKKYTICVGMKDNVISMYIDGTIIGYSYSEEFTNNLNVVTPASIILGSTALTNTGASGGMLTGKLGNINISSGPTVKHEESYTKYGTNLVSFLNFENLAGIGTYKTGVEAVYNGIEWSGVESATYSGGYGNIKNISTDLTGDFTVMFSLKKFKVANANILKYGNYSVDYVAGFIPEPDPDVEVNEYTTSALNFENGLVDQVGTTIWQKEGTADITSVNKIFGESSFETKALGDSLYTNSNIITGGSTPFTIEYYFLYKGKNTPENNAWDAPIFTKYDGADQGNYLNSNTYNLSFYKSISAGGNADTENANLVFGKTKLLPNTINKVTMTYDSSAIRVFINDKLDNIIGSNGLSTNNKPLRFLSRYDDVHATNNKASTTFGLIDNINIHDGIATKVRDPDPYEEFLVVDLAFDGENNSTKIIDNAYSTTEDKYNNFVVSLLHFDESLVGDECGNIWVAKGNSTLANTGYFGDSSFYSDGSNNSCIYMSSTIPKLNNSDFCIEFFYKSTNNNSIRAFFSTYGYSDTSERNLHISSNNGKLSATFIIEPTNNDIELNTWYHIAYTRQGSLFRLFLNGVLVGTGASNDSIVTTGYFLAIQPYNTTWVRSGYYDEFRLTIGVPRYTSNFDIPTKKYSYTKINKWSVNGNAKLSTAQKFDGFSSLYLDGSSHVTTKFSDAFNFIGSDITLSFEFIPTNLATTVGQQQILIASWDSSNNTRSFFILIEKESTGHSIQFGISQDGLAISNPIKFNVILTNNVRYKIDLIISNNVTLYLNGIIVNSFKNNYTHQYISNVSIVAIGSHLNNASRFIGYIKNFKIYKGVAVIPEDPTGKIQLDFDNNLVDKYGNSTWTNNGVTFNQVNSVKGYAAYFNGNSRLTTNLNDNLNFGKNNFKLSMDFNLTDFSGWNTFITSYGNGVGGSTISYNNTSNTTRVRLDLNNYFDFPSYHVLNSYYNICQTRVGDSLLYKINDVVQSCFNTSLPLNHNSNSKTTISGLDFTNSENIKGYIDNFKSIKDYKGEVIIDIPAVHLPLETNAINTGFTPLTINSVGNPTYTTIDGKKCIKFESGKYLTINSNNIFNLGNSSDFYIEFDFYVIAFRNGAGGGTDSSIIRNTGNWDNNSSAIQFNSNGNILLYGKNNNLYTTINNFGLNVFNKLIVKRQNSLVSIILNGTVETVNNFELDFSLNDTLLGAVDRSPYAYLNGYMSNFKMFVGTSEIPETYNDKKVLDLDFKPTGKSYLFKDNNNKCVIHPVNITQRDYQDSQYCCTFNGTNQYLQLGKNDLLNFGLDDFVIEIVFKTNTTSQDFQSLIAASGDNIGRTYIALRGSNLDVINPPTGNDGKQRISLSNTGGTGIFISRNKYQVDEKTKITFVKEGGKLSLYINDILDSSTTTYTFDSNLLIANANFNFNLNSNTVIGRSAANEVEYFKGTIYSIKVLRNTSDISLLEDENTDVDVIIEDTTLTLSNGTDSQEVIFDNKNQNDFRFVHSNDSTKLIVNEQILEVPNVENESNELSLFTDFNAEAKDIKTYNIAFEDEDTFSGNVPIHTQFGEIEEISTLSDDFIVVDQGDFIVKGFFEGRPEDSRYQIQNRFDKFIVHTGSGPFDYNGLNERFIDDYEIYLPDTKETMPIPTEPMIRGYITISITPTECEGVNFGVKVFRRSDNKLIGIYDFNNYVCTIDNLDCNKRYDCIIFDKDVNLESRCLSNRTPLPY